MIQSHSRSFMSSSLIELTMFWWDNHVAGSISAIDLHFEDPTSGFLIKEISSSSVNNNQEDVLQGPDSTKFITNVTVFGTHRSVNLKASHGPFLTRQSISPTTFLGKFPVWSWLVKYLQHWNNGGKKYLVREDYTICKAIQSQLWFNLTD